MCDLTTSFPLPLSIHTHVYLYQKYSGVELEAEWEAEQKKKRAQCVVTDACMHPSTHVHCCSTHTPPHQIPPKKQGPGGVGRVGRRGRGPVRHQRGRRPPLRLLHLPGRLPVRCFFACFCLFVVGGRGCAVCVRALGATTKPGGEGKTNEPRLQSLIRPDPNTHTRWLAGWCEQGSRGDGLWALLLLRLRAGAAQAGPHGA